MENTQMEAKRKTDLTTYIFLTIGLIPFILITIYIDDESPSELSLFLSTFIDNFMLGPVGATSSSFPIFSKIMANYNAFVVPLLSVSMYLFLTIMRKKPDVPISFDYSVNQYIKVMFAISLFYLIFLVILCLSNIDLDDHNRLGTFSRNKYTLSFLYMAFLYPLWFILNYSILFAYTSFTKKFFVVRRASKK
ncbi:colicin immunity protein Cui [Yersinia alsatica]|uniref:colicin immunity protein Cui n=1 Tax=Yersinia alsatica TaxID=2890317 RepID=UPI0011A63F16